jgi:KTSC domain
MNKAPAHPPLTEVKSSIIHSCAHDPKTQRLYLKFHNSGRVYAYDGVPAETHAEMLKAESLGRFFGQKIRAKYKHSKL